MAKSNWTIKTGPNPSYYGGWQVDTGNTPAPPSGSYSMRSTSFKSYFLYNGKSDFGDNLISCNFYQPAGAYLYGNYLYSRYSAITPGNGYYLQFYSNSAVISYMRLGRWNAGVDTTLVSYTSCAVTNGLTTWQKVRFSTETQSDGYVHLKADFWNRAIGAWSWCIDYMDISAGRITATGYCGFGFDSSIGFNWLDDWSVTELTGVIT